MDMDKSPRGGGGANTFSNDDPLQFCADQFP
jgi:hypothetical protein